MSVQNFIPVHPVVCCDISVWTEVVCRPTNRLPSPEPCPKHWLQTIFTITPSSTSQIPWGSSSNAARWSQINRFISFIWKGLGSCLFPSPPLLPGVHWWGLFAATHSFMFFDLLVCEVVNVWEAYQVQGGYPCSFVCPTLSESLRRSKCLIVLVIWLLWCVMMDGNAV